MITDALKNEMGGTSALLLGNEAVARGAVEAGVWVASCYPGTPSSEVADTLAELSKTFNFDFTSCYIDTLSLNVGGQNAASAIRIAADFYDTIDCQVCNICQTIKIRMGIGGNGVTHNN